MRDATISRFNPPAEPARTVRFGKRDLAWTVGFENQAASAREIPEKPSNERTRERFDCERERETLFLLWQFYVGQFDIN